MVFAGLISAGVGAILLLAGVLGLVSAKFRTILRGIPVANKILDPMTWSVVFLIIGILAGGWGVITSYVSVGDISGGEETMAIGTTGGFDLKIHDGLVNATTTSDYYNDDDTFLTLYSADANIGDGEEFVWNITIERELASEDSVIEVSCNIPDKELSGVTEDNIAEKTSGQVDLDINDGGRHSDDNTVYKKFGLAEGTITQEVQVAFDQEENYHDGMSDLSDYVDIVCTVSGDDGSSNFVTTRIYANS